MPDTDDLHQLVAAVTGGADFVITDNTTDLPGRIRSRRRHSCGPTDWPATPRRRSVLLLIRREREPKVVSQAISGSRRFGEVIQSRRSERSRGRVFLGRLPTLSTTAQRVRSPRRYIQTSPHQSPQPDWLFLPSAIATEVIAAALRRAGQRGAWCSRLVRSRRGRVAQRGSPAAWSEPRSRTGPAQVPANDHAFRAARPSR